MREVYKKSLMKREVKKQLIGGGGVKKKGLAE